ncbi:TIR domain protein [Methyloversatilis sp. RAC08]|uniref:CHAT domain-containing protein n=1 Tax=Methyloversatilis sp. RAC08 TaxID=1842540 RepID=UPI00083CE34C|nr:CHAT domain-containing protein [Methyloversatilis sp. RAC08]AOF80369.1 TIR domain protein [Methyloversatilis sp. RAC08]
MKIFLSYASEIRARAEGVNAALQAAGHDVFFDREDLPAGLNYDDRIRSAIESSDLFVFLLSPAAVAEGHYTRTELKIARRRWPDPAGHVLPVMVEATPFSALPPYLGSVTVLVPEGNLAAEVVLAVADIERLPSHAATEPDAVTPPPDSPDATPTYASLKVRFSYAEAGRYTVDINSPQAVDGFSGDCAIDAPAIEDAMRGAAVGDTLRRPPGALAHNGLPTAAQARDAGTLLYRALFGPTLRTGIEDSLRAIDPQQGKGLRFVIDTTDTPELGRLPWEFLYSPEKDDFLFSDRMKPVVRWLDVDEPTPTLSISPPLRVLIAFAAPGGLAPLSIGDELARLDQALAPLTKRGLIGITRLENATLERLDDALLTVRPHVLHFIGHGDFNGGDGLLLLESDTPDRAPDPLTGRRLGVLLRNHLANLRLVFLNSCMGGAVSPVDPFGGIAQTLIRRGVPAVIAMQFAIPDKAAVELSRHFYRYLAAGQPVDAALTSARAFLFARGHEVEWGAPALHMRSPDGRLFTIAPPATPAVVPLAVPVALPAVEPEAAPVREPGASHAAAPEAAQEQAPPSLAPVTVPVPETVPIAARSSRTLLYGALAALLLLVIGVALLTFNASDLAPSSAEPAGTAPAARPVSAPETQAERTRLAVAQAIAQLEAGQDVAAAATLQELLRLDPDALDPASLGADAQRLSVLLWDAAQRAADPALGALFAHLSGWVGNVVASAGEPPDFAVDSKVEPAAGTDRGEALYTVRRGDTLEGIAKRLLGDAREWTFILERHNAASALAPGLRRISDPDYILAGEYLAVPVTADEAGLPGWPYHVQPGDSLWGIATRMYGQGRLWPRIADANTDTVPDPSRLQPGLLLFVPAPAR